MAETRIDRRVQKLERTCRRQAAALWGMALLGCTAALAGAQKSPAVVTARAFQVVDDKGQIRGIFQNRGDHTMLELFDAAGEPRVSMTASRTFGEVEAIGPSERSAALSYQAGIGCAITVAGPQGEWVVRLPPKGEVDRPK